VVGGLLVDVRLLHCGAHDEEVVFRLDLGMLVELRCGEAPFLALAVVEGDLCLAVVCVGMSRRSAVEGVFGLYHMVRHHNGVVVDSCGRSYRCYEGAEDLYDCCSLHFGRGEQAFVRRSHTRVCHLGRPVYHTVVIDLGSHTRSVDQCQPDHLQGLEVASDLPLVFACQIRASLPLQADLLAELVTEVYGSRDAGAHQ